MAWTETARRQYARRGRRYSSDLTDPEWAILAPLLPPARSTGRPRTTDLRAVMDAVLYMASSGCQWSLLPGEFPPPSTVQRYFYAWRDSGLLAIINHHLVMAARELEVALRHRVLLARLVGRDASIDLLIDNIREGLRRKPYDVLNNRGRLGVSHAGRLSKCHAISAAAPEGRIDLGQNEAMVLVSIAFNQPITRGGVSEMLGREVSRDVIGALRDKNMITAEPRSPTAGAPFM